MNILLIDNRTIHLDKFRSLLAGFTLSVLSPDRLSGINTGSFDAIVLSGSSANSVMGNEEYYGQELSLIKNTAVPIIGVCIGLELIAKAYGGTLMRLDDRIEGWQEVLPVKEGGVLGTAKRFTVYEGHRWIVSALPPELEGLARSDAGWEVVKHVDKPIYGLQFHPEVSDSFHGDGRTIFNNILGDILR